MDEKNSKHTPEEFEEEPKKKSKKHILKMPAFTKRTTSAIYMGIAVCMVAVLTVSLVSTGNKVKKGVDDLNDISMVIPDISIGTPNSGVQQQPNNKPTGTDTPGVDAEVILPEPEISVPVVVPTYVRPVSGEVLKGYYADSLVFSQTMQDYRTHTGVDIAASLGTDVVAYTDGVVNKIEHHPFMGTSIEIKHDAGVVSVYRNLAKDLAPGITVGSEVKSGDVIASVGDTAILEVADAPHLHFELWMDGECINSEQELSALK